MITLKCKKCGGELEIIDHEKSICECQYCGSKETLPTVDSEKIVKLYDRAYRLRMSNEFDKAAGVYESIIEESDTEAEAYWGLVLCKYGIEYVDDPATGTKIPTCHRSSFDSVMEDSDFELVMGNADALARSVYRDNAKQIEEIRKGIIEVSGKEAPYDIFICYKETDENGDRTVDSVIAQNVYEALTAKGYRVFFSRITLEDKLGQVYEPYIFAALNSAKIMLAFGTSYDYYNAVWVKNEWSRYLKLMAKDSEKHLIPCYKDIDAYDIPKEFKHLQAQDMGKVGADQDLLRGIDKILRSKEKSDDVNSNVSGSTQQDINAAIASAMATNANGNVTALLKRGNMSLEDKEWQKADGFFEEVLNLDAECAEAYIGKFFADNHLTSFEELKIFLSKTYENETEELMTACDAETEHIENMVRECAVEHWIKEAEIRVLYDFDLSYTSAINCRNSQMESLNKLIDGNRILSRGRAFATGKLHEDLEVCLEIVVGNFKKILEAAKKDDQQKKDEIVKNYKEYIETADARARELYRVAIEEKDKAYEEGIKMFEKAGEDVEKYSEARRRFIWLNGYRDSDEYANLCDEKVNGIYAAQNEAEQKTEKLKSIIVIVFGVILLLVFVLMVFLSDGNEDKISSNSVAKGNEAKVDEKVYEKVYEKGKNDIGVKSKEKNIKDIDPKTNSDVTKLLENYYKYYCESNIEELEKIACPISDNEKKYINVLSQFYEGIENIKCEYYEHYDEVLIISISTELKLYDVDTKAPMLDLFVIKMNEVGNIYIDNTCSSYNLSIADTAIDADIYEHLSDYVMQADFAKARDSVQEEYEKAIDSDKKLNKMLTETIDAAIREWYDSVEMPN